MLNTRDLIFDKKPYFSALIRIRIMKNDTLSVVDVVAILTDSQNPRKYWSV